MAFHGKRCALCLGAGKLMNSHLVPKAIYRRLRKGVAKDLSSPALVDSVSGTTVLTDSQPTHWLLCFKCEQTFSNKGENAVISELRSNGNFNLRDKCLAGVKLVKSVDKSPSTMLDRNAYFYFSISLAWRMSVADWGHPYNSGFGKLGPFEEKMRLWLLGGSNDMEKIRVEILVDIDQNSPAMGGPDVSRHSDLSMNASIYQLVALGVWFRVHVGGQLTRKGREYFGRSKVPIVFRKVSFESMGMTEYVNDMAVKTKYKGKLARVR